MGIGSKLIETWNSAKQGISNKLGQAWEGVKGVASKFAEGAREAGTWVADHAEPIAAVLGGAGMGALTAYASPVIRAGAREVIGGISNMLPEGRWKNVINSFVGNAPPASKPVRVDLTQVVPGYDNNSQRPTTTGNYKVKANGIPAPPPPTATQPDVVFVNSQAQPNQKQNTTEGQYIRKRSTGGRTVRSPIPKFDYAAYDERQRAARKKRREDAKKKKEEEEKERERTSPVRITQGMVDAANAVLKAAKNKKK